MSATRMTEVGTVSCRGCGLLVGVLRAQTSASPRVAPRLVVSPEPRLCRCPTTHLPGLQALPPSVLAQLDRVVEATSRVRPWEQVVAPQPLHLRV